MSDYCPKCGYPDISKEHHMIGVNAYKTYIICPGCGKRTYENTYAGVPEVKQ